MLYYIESTHTDPRYNLALEQYVFDRMDRQHQYCMLWQNDNAIIIGKHQNTIAEINAAFVKEHDIRVVRRMSGGGAVYHDLGNLNFTFIVDAVEGEGLDFKAFCQPVIRALGSMGVTAELSGRNDMTIDNKKFSGNAQYIRQGRVLHHGTLLFDSKLDMIAQALQVSGDKIESKGLKSVRSRVTNIRPYLPQDFALSDFWNALREFLFRENNMQPYTLTDEDLAGVAEIKNSVYDAWEWNYGYSPAYKLHKERRFEGCGKVEVFLDVTKGGIINDVLFYGDFFSEQDPSELIGALKGKTLQEDMMRSIALEQPIGKYFRGLQPDAFVSLMLQ